MQIQIMKTSLHFLSLQQYRRPGIIVEHVMFSVLFDQNLYHSGCQRIAREVLAPNGEPMISSQNTF